MTTDPRLLSTLNSLLADEMAAIHQYLAHRQRALTWGYTVFVEYIDERIADERKHAEALTKRIYELGGQPALVGVGQVNIAPDVVASFTPDGAAEQRAIDRYNLAITLCVALKDDVTRDIFAENVGDENDHLADIEARVTQIRQTGAQNFLSTQVGK